ncbi:6652_t:CDS:2, partial [Scutellospora calospora]
QIQNEEMEETFTVFKRKINYINQEKLEIEVEIISTFMEAQKAYEKINCDWRELKPASETPLPEEVPKWSSKCLKDSSTHLYPISLLWYPEPPLCLTHHTSCPIKNIQK